MESVDPVFQRDHEITMWLFFILFLIAGDEGVESWFEEMERFYNLHEVKIENKVRNRAQLDEESVPSFPFLSRYSECCDRSQKENTRTMFEVGLSGWRMHLNAKMHFELECANM